MLRTISSNYGSENKKNRNCFREPVSVPAGGSRFLVTFFNHSQKRFLAAKLNQIFSQSKPDICLIPVFGEFIAKSSPWNRTHLQAKPLKAEAFAILGQSISKPVTFVRCRLTSNGFKPIFQLILVGKPRTQSGKQGWEKPGWIRFWSKQYGFVRQMDPVPASSGYCSSCTCNEINCSQPALKVHAVIEGFH